MTCRKVLILCGKPDQTQFVLRFCGGGGGQALPIRQKRPFDWSVYETNIA